MALSTEIKSILEVIDKPSLILRKDFTIAYGNKAFRRKYGSFNLEGRKCHEVVFLDSRPCSACGLECPLERAIVTGTSERAVRREFVPGGENLIEIKTTPISSADGTAEYYIETINDSSCDRGMVDRAGLITESLAVKKVIKQLSKLALIDSVVMFSGEAGSGKEVFARFLHENSRRAAQPFIKIGCAGLDKDGFENELLGLRGPGGGERRGGLLSELSGTLFFDEVSELSPYLQYQLLNMLETGFVRSEGSASCRAVDFRIMCSTKSNLAELVSEGRFRRDLYHRLKVFEVCVPSLHDRREDIAPMVEMIAAKMGEGAKQFSNEALVYLSSKSWPGNARELVCLVEKLLIFSDSSEITAGDVKSYEDVWEESQSSVGPRNLGLSQAVERWTGSRRELADFMGVSERTLYRRLKAERERTDSRSED